MGCLQLLLGVSPTLPLLTVELNFYFLHNIINKLLYSNLCQYPNDSKLNCGGFVDVSKRTRRYFSTIDIIENQNFPQQYSADLRIIPTEDLK